jgi:Protein of unknown function (DUF2911)
VRLSAFLLVLAATPLAAQLRSAPSTRVTIEVTLNPPRPAQGQPAGTPAKIKLDYGQPHARGRAVEGALKADLDTVWRLGANTSTTLTTDVDLVIGGATVPKGAYSLYARTSSKGAWKLIINKNTGQWGTEYVKAQDLATVDLASKTLPVSIESFVISMVPAGDGSPKGDLRITWGTREFTTTWAMK